MLYHLYAHPGLASPVLEQKTSSLTSGAVLYDTSYERTLLQIRGFWPNSHQSLEIRPHVCGERNTCLKTKSTPSSFSLTHHPFAVVAAVIYTAVTGNLQRMLQINRTKLCSPCQSSGQNYMHRSHARYTTLTTRDAHQGHFSIGFTWPKHRPRPVQI